VGVVIFQAILVFSEV